MKIVMPKLGLTMTEATLSRWRKAEGEAVSRDEILFEFESDKSLLEFECPADGVLSQILVAEGETVPCGTPLAVVEPVFEGAGVAVAGEQGSRGAREQGSRGAEEQGSRGAREQGSRGAREQGSRGAEELGSRGVGEPRSDNRMQSQSSGGVVATPAAKRRARELGLELAALSGRGPNGRVQLVDVETARHLEAAETAAVTPMAKRLAEELAVDLGQVKGSGAGGRVVKEDILQAARPQAPVAGLTYDSRPLSTVRQLIGQRMSDSAFTAPHVTLFSEADATALVEARRQINAELQDAIKISYNTLLIALVARALRQNPALNAGIVGQEIRQYHHINVALAVDTERGLLVPVIRQADQLSLSEIQTTSENLIRLALEGKSRPDDFSDGTFTITNLGMFEIDGFTPIINPPQAAILGVGRIAPKPVVLEGQVMVRQMMALSLSFDHRLIDGGPAARFLQGVKQLIERPFALVVPLDNE